MPTALEARIQDEAQQQVSRAAAARAVHEAFAWFQAHEREISDLQLQIARIPAPPFVEGARAAFLRDLFVTLGLHNVHIDAVGNVLGMRPGADGAAKYVALSAHI